ncbi:MAG: hypothetical protein GPJ54_15750, partial [Candidatus Heimdallarchaeota archaeon]|nr:hypothetical protein [Candidatus Heimdallarchaeota archaeon]
NLGPLSSSANDTTFDVTAPGTVTGLTATAVSASQINLSWNANSEADLQLYMIYRNGLWIANTSLTTFSDTGLNEGITYNYQVSAIDSSENEGIYSAIASATTLDYTPPSQVTGLTVSAVSGSQINLSWNANSEPDLQIYMIYRDSVWIANTSLTIYSDVGLDSETMYSYYIAAVDNSENKGPNSVTVSDTTPDVTPPSQVLGLSANIIGESQINLSWNANSEPDLQLYMIYRDGVWIANTSLTSYSDTGLNDGITYNYQVSAVDNSENESIYSAIASATTPDITPPAQVTGLTATTVSGSQINLSWNANSELDLQLYMIYRDSVWIANTSLTIYSDVGLDSETMYSYYIAAVDNSENKGLNSVTVSDTTPDVTPPNQVLGLSANTISASQINLNWNANSEPDLQLYMIYRDGVWIANTSLTSYSDTGLNDGITYNYQVSAVDISENEGIYSTIASVTTPDITPPAQVAGLAATAVSGSQINLSWISNSDTDIQLYMIYRDGTWITNETDTSYIDIGLADGTTYDYGISAVDSSENVGISSYISVRTLDSVPPSQVTGLQSQIISGTQIYISWDASSESDLLLYMIYRDGLWIANETGNNHLDFALNDGTTYIYQVSAVDTSENEGIKSSTIIVTTPDVTPPNQVIGLSAMVISDSQINLNWDANSEEDLQLYMIYRNGIWIANETGAFYSDYGLDDGITYYYQVSAVDKTENEGLKSSNVSATTPDITAPEQVTGLIATPFSDSQIDLSWDANSEPDLQHYMVYQNGLWIANTSLNFYADIGLNFNTKYTYLIIAVDKSGNIGIQSELVTATTYPRTIEFSITDISDLTVLIDDEFVLEWKITGYGGQYDITLDGIAVQSADWVDGEVIKFKGSFNSAGNYVIKIIIIESETNLVMTDIINIEVILFEIVDYSPIMIIGLEGNQVTSVDFTWTYRSGIDFTYEIINEKGEVISNNYAHKGESQIVYTMSFNYENEGNKYEIVLVIDLKNGLIFESTIVYIVTDQILDISTSINDKEQQFIVTMNSLIEYEIKFRVTIKWDTSIEGFDLKLNDASFNPTYDEGFLSFEVTLFKYQSDLTIVFDYVQENEEEVPINVRVDGYILSNEKYSIYGAEKLILDFDHQIPTASDSEFLPFNLYFSLFALISLITLIKYRKK